MLEVHASPSRKTSRSEGSNTPTTPRAVLSAAAALLLPSPETVRFEASGTTLPRKVVNELSSAGGAVVVRKLGLTTIEFTSTECAAYDRYVQWLDSLPDESDPVVSAVLVAPHIVAEIMAILGHYAGMMAADFQGGQVPVLPAFAPAAPVPPAVRFHTAQTSLHLVVHAIRNPGPGYPAINALPPGTPICTLQKGWARGVFDFVPIVR